MGESPFFHKYRYCTLFKKQNPNSHKLRGFIFLYKYIEFQLSTMASNYSV